ncbi:recombination protein RecR [Candidatus Peregrinibacteria bacterium]|nr:MAG: recombination protein RecR [Candidatus Peregrinibacteria bacterium]
MDFLPDSLTKLIEELGRLPGIGPKSAQRLAFHLLKSADFKVHGLGEAILNVKNGVQECGHCFSLTTSNPCKICSGPGRDRSLLCVIESTLDLIAIEKTGEYKGLYHVLQGRLSPLDGVGLEQLRITELFVRLSESGCETRELILALNPDLEGDTTALYIQKQVASFSALHVSRIARGIPSGGHLEYTDDATLIRALEGRQRLI